MMEISPPSGRLIAIGDIHGNAAALETILDAIWPQRSDTVITLGDYIDRGPDTRRVIEMLLRLGERCRYIPIMGNHEEVLLTLLDGRPMRITFADWLSFGGEETLASYGVQTVSELPVEHTAFLRNSITYYATDDYFFTHAMYLPEIPLRYQSKQVLRWGRFWTESDIPGPHRSGRHAIVGHTAQSEGQIVVRDHFTCLDSGCYRPRGVLTAMNVRTGELWQADQMGTISPTAW